MRPLLVPAFALAAACAPSPAATDWRPSSTGGEIAGPRPVHLTPLLTGESAYLPPGSKTLVLAERDVFFECQPGTPPCPVRRLITVYRVLGDQGREMYAAPELAIEPPKEPGGKAQLVFDPEPRQGAIAVGLALLAAASLAGAIAWRLRARERMREPVAALALATAGAALIQLGTYGRFVSYGGDESAYLAMVHEILGGSLRPHAHGFGWPILLAPIAAIASLPEDALEASWKIGPLLAAAISAGTAALTALIAHRLWASRTRAILAGAGWALWAVAIRHPFVGWPPETFSGRSMLGPPGWFAFDNPWSMDQHFFAIRTGYSLLSDAPATLVGLFSLLLALEARSKEGPSAVSARRWWIVSGLAAGWSLTIRPAAAIALLPWAAIVAGWLGPARASSLRQRVPWFFWAGAAAVLAYAPTVIAATVWTGGLAFDTFRLAGVQRPFSLEWVGHGLALHAAFHGPVVVLAAAGLISAARSEAPRARLSASVLAAAVLVQFAVIATFRAGSSQPARLLLPVFPLLAISAAAFGLGAGRSIASIVIFALALAFVPGLPVPPVLSTPIPSGVYVAAPAVMIAVVIAAFRAIGGARAFSLAAVIAGAASAAAAWFVPFVSLVAVFVAAAAGHQRPSQRSTRSKAKQ